MNSTASHPRRTDVHSPINLVTEDYEYAYAYDAHPHEGDRGACVPIVNMLLAEGYKFTQVHGGDTCDHCGARLRYVAVLKHLPTKGLIKVGETCLDNRFSLATNDFHRLRKNAQLNRERQTKMIVREKFMDNPDNKVAFDFADESVSKGDYGFEGFRFRFVHVVNRDGQASEKFVAAILRDKARQDEREAQRAAEAAAHPAAPVVEGKIVVTGEIISIKLHENNYGTREVMTVRDDRGFKVWGTQPTSLYDAKRGDRVTFTATVEKSDRDETFGFFKRPSKAELLDSAA